MFKLVLKSQSRYVIIAIITVISLVVYRTVNDLNFPEINAILLLTIPLLFILGFEKNVFAGRYTNRAILVWLVSMILAALVFFILAGIIGSTYNLLGLGEFKKNKILVSFFSVVGLSLILYFLFKLLQVFYKRFQDYNQPGYYFFIGLLPVLCWFVGVKIYKSGQRVLGVLVFLNSSISIFHIIFGIGNDYSNYFGINPELKDDYKKEKRAILKNKFLAEEEKQKLIITLRQKYSEFESKELSEFRAIEIERRLKKELMKFKFVSKEEILSKEMQNIHQNRIIDFHSKIVEQHIERYYKYADWDKL